MTQPQDAPPDTLGAALPSPGWHAAWGLAQGAALWLLWDQAQEWIAHPGPFAGMVYLALALPLAWHLSHGGFRSGRQRLAFSLALGLLFAGLGVHAGNASGAPLQRSFDPVGASLLPGVVLGFVLVPLVAGFDLARRRFDYPRLFELAWRNAMLLPVGGALTLILWTLLWAGAWLMESIGLKGMRRVLTEPAFAFILTAGAFGLSLGLALARVGTLLMFRRFWLSLTAWFLPLALGFAVAWLCALPFTGVEPLFATRNAAFYLFWFVALTVTFVNAAFQDGREAPAFPRWLAASLAWAWWALPVLVLLADWALWQRVAQHGWTPDRLWAAVVGGLLTVHVAGYAGSMLGRRGATPWMRALPATNVAVAVLGSVVIAALISPVADAQRISVASQVARLMEGVVRPEAFDWEFLRSRSGATGRAALKALAAQVVSQDEPVRQIALRAGKELQSTGRPGRDVDPQDASLALAALRERVAVLPLGAVAEPALLDALSGPHADWEARACAAVPQECRIWLVDLDRDGQAEAVLLWRQGAEVRAPIYAKGTTRWNKVDRHRLEGGTLTLADWERAIQDGRAQPVAPRWSDVMVGDQRVTVGH